DTPEKSKLLASRISVEERADFIRVDSLGFLSIDGLYRAVGEAARNNEFPQFCDACFTGQYPTKLSDFEHSDNKRTLSLLAAGGSSDEPDFSTIMPDPIPDPTGRIAVVTGASRGIGYFSAKHMAAAGAHVIAVARTVGGLEELDDEIKAERARTGKGEATLVPLDLADMEGIDRLGGAIYERWGKLDILVASAGVLGTISPIGHVEA